MALIAHYPLNGDTKDYSGYGNDGTAVGDTDFIMDGKIGEAVRFNKKSSYITSNNKLVDYTNNEHIVSICMWVKLESFVGESWLAAQYDRAGSDRTILSIQPNRLVRYFIGGRSIHSKTIVPVSEWFHVGVIKRSDGLISIYLNGNADGGGLLQGKWGDTDTVFGNSHSREMPFELNDIRIYDHALSDKEVKEIAKAKVLHYKFDEQDLTTKIVKDCSGFGNDGTVAVTTAPSWSEDSPVGRGSMEFGGSLITTGKIFYNNEQEHTVSAWVKPTNIGISNQELVNFHQGYKLFHTSSGKTLMYMNAGANNHYVYGNSLAENKWTHVTWVYDKSSLRCQVYYNGVLHASSTNFTAIDVPSGFKATTILGGNFVGNISDVRIYATALTPEDILELYQTRASVDNEGNLFVQEIDEISDTSKEVDSRGIARFKEFNEVDGESKMSIKNDGVVYVNEIMEA